VTPLVSVVIPTFRRLVYLREALGSALEQTYENLEILLCDDDASDEVADLVAEFADDRVKHRRNTDRLGMGPNKVTGYRAAQGKYFVNLDDDDAWERGFLTSLIEPMEADDELALAFCDQLVIDECGAVDEARSKQINEHYRGGLLPGKHAPFCNLGLVKRAVPMAAGTVVRKSAVDLSHFPLAADVTGDLWLTYLACRRGGGAYYLPERLARYRVHSASSTSEGGFNWHRSYVSCYEGFLADPYLRAHHDHFREALGVARGNAALALLREGRRAEARAWARAGVRVHTSPRSLAILGWTLLPFIASSGARRRRV
jgi:glycosyltransferase involved in cell wall biosynthesis